MADITLTPEQYGLIWDFLARTPVADDEPPDAPRIVVSISINLEEASAQAKAA